MIRLIDHAFNPGAELNAFCAGRVSTGAVASFVGLARGAAEGRAALELEAYAGFTDAAIADMAEEATRLFGLQDVRIVHRIGAIPAGEAIVLVLTAAAHRRAAFEACDYLMDHLKSRAPLWKKEHGRRAPRARPNDARGSQGSSGFHEGRGARRSRHLPTRPRGRPAERSQNSPRLVIPMKNNLSMPRHLLTGLCLTAFVTPAFYAEAGLVTPAVMRATAATAAPIHPENSSAFLRVVLPKQDLTVGEQVPVEVKAYFRAGVSASLNGLPILGSDAFSLNKLDDHPEQARESLNGVPYTVVTWTSALSAVKAGDYPLNVELPVMVRVQERGQRGRGGRNPLKDFFGDDSPFAGAFDDSFFDDFFGQATEKPLTLHTDGEPVHIMPLPTQGRPVGFSGAVGQFEVSSEVSSANATSGDPLTLKLSVTGRGNFDRVATAGLPASPGWKSYKPSAQFAPADASGTSGTKTFTQSIVPTQAGAQQVPAVAFSYFDPEAQQYVTKHTAPIALEVAPGTPSPAPAVTNAPAPEAPTGPKAPLDGLAPDEVVSDHGATNLQPLVLAPWFLAGNALLAGALAVGGFARLLRRRRARDPERQQQQEAERAAHESLAALEAAQKAQDAKRFFIVAREALQQRLAAHWHLPAARVTLPEIHARLNGHGEELRSIFQTADEFAYSGRRWTAPDLRQWRALVETQLQQISRL